MVLELKQGLGLQSSHHLLDYRGTQAKSNAVQSLCRQPSSQQTSPIAHVCQDLGRLQRRLKLLQYLDMQLECHPSFQHLPRSPHVDAAYVYTHQPRPAGPPVPAKHSRFTTASLSP